ncbi:hypothetical protein QBC39DRAFT_351316 [Podospora conica]|nr:hypothetical protein QBC39DRAFT_351316 [Schizothecium conicum]
MQRAPSRKRVFGQNLPLVIPVDGLVGQKRERPSASPEKKKFVEVVRPVEEKQRASQRQEAKPEGEETGSPAKKRLRLSPVAKEATQDRVQASKADPTPVAPKVCEDKYELEENKTTGNTGRDTIRTGQEGEAGRLTPAREGTPSINKTTGPISDAKPAALVQQTRTPRPTQPPSVSSSKMPPPGRARSETVVANPPPHQPSPPVCNREPVPSKPPASSTAAHPSTDHAPGPDPQGPSTLAAFAKPRPTTTHPAPLPTKSPVAASPDISSKPQGPGVREFPSAGAPARPHPQPVPARPSAKPPISRPAVLPPRPAPNAYAKPSTRSGPPPLTAQSLGYLPPVQARGAPKPAAPRPAPNVYAKRSAYTGPPPLTAQSLGYLPPVQPRGPPKPAAPVPAFIRPARPSRPQHSPAVTAFKSNHVSTGPTAFQRPKFLAKPANPSTPTNPGMHTAGPWAGTEPPSSTQMFLEMHGDSLLPSPSQEERELQECSPAPPRGPAFLNPRPISTSRPQVPQFKQKPPVPAFNGKPAPRPKPAPRQPMSVKPISFQAVQVDDGLPFISTQDLSFSSQDMREVEESSTPSKAAPKPWAGPRPSPLSSHGPSLAKASPLPRVLPAVGKGSATEGPAQQTPIQTANPPSCAVQPLSFGKGSATRGPAQQTPIQTVNPSDDNREQPQKDKAESCGGGQGPGTLLLSQETDYGDLDLDAADLAGF